MKTVPAAQFKAQCLSLLDRVGPEGIVITKHGKPVAKLIPIATDAATLIGSLKGKLTIKGDILSTGVRWNAESRYPHPPRRARR
ncbi:MAG: type II toxin-antitoxin system prevent-host-death family antitoxin [Candidatus Rokuibacteriota bacterium]|nr:MAG: type II toxin-antitoxin system prevent-host-death family antitoxin [Candidatus Rokubacteria bacterium]